MIIMKKKHKRKLLRKMSAVEIRREMRKALAEITGFVFRHSPVFYEQKRLRLSMRLHRVFDMDFIEGSLDSMVRSYLAKK